MSPTLLELTAPRTALNHLVQGNQRFTQNLRINRNLLFEMDATKEKQEPFAVVISCMDSRTAPELIFDQGIGDIFSIRIAGNVITPEVVGSTEFACGVVGSKVVLVLGHHGCGAIKGTMENVTLGSLLSITEKIRFSVKENLTIEEVTRRNVERGVQLLTEQSPLLKQLVEQSKLQIIGGIYDVSTGQVEFL